MHARYRAPSEPHRILLPSSTDMKPENTLKLAVCSLSLNYLKAAASGSVQH